MSKADPIDAIKAIRIIPAAVIDDADAAVPLAEALLEGGLNVLEVTLRTDKALEAIRRVAAGCPEMRLGAGTVLTGEDLRRAVDAGSRFALAPGLDEETIARAAELGIAFIPGVATPSEVGRAIRLGCRLLKFFPASQLGGPAMLSAQAAPFVHTGVRFVPTGGIDATNAAAYLALPVVAAVGGTWMVKRDLIAGGRWKDIARLAREAVAACAPAR